jgi:hypothetical protein
MIDDSEEIVQIVTKVTALHLAQKGAECDIMNG